MKNTRTIAAVIGSIVAITLGAVATAAIADDDPRTPKPPARSTTYVEPSGYRLGDGTYLGYVRVAGRPDTSVAVDFVSVTDGATENTQPERLVDAGSLANLDIFDLVRRPFRIVVEDETIVEVQTSDDLYEADTPTEQKLRGSIRWVSGANGKVSVVIGGQTYDVSDSEWWDFEKRVLNEMIDSLQNQ